MTFITYQASVHFADDILEEALFAELERARLMRPLIVFDQSSDSQNQLHRISDALPVRRKYVTKDYTEISPLKGARRRNKPLADIEFDCVIGFGSVDALEKARQFAHRSNQVRAANDSKPPRLILVPGATGLPTGSLHASNKHKSGHLGYAIDMNTLAICDPSLTLNIGRDETFYGSIVAITRCVEALMGQAYNPPAYGIALDGLSRTMQHLMPVLNNDDITNRRELMAGALNGVMASEHGLKLLEPLTQGIAEKSEEEIDFAHLYCVMLPALVQAFETQKAILHYDHLKRALGVPDGVTISVWLHEFLSPLAPDNCDKTLAAISYHLEDVLHNVRAAGALPSNVIEAFLEQILQSSETDDMNAHRRYNASSLH